MLSNRAHWTSTIIFFVLDWQLSYQDAVIFSVAPGHLLWRRGKAPPALPERARDPAPFREAPIRAAIRPQSAGAPPRDNRGSSEMFRSSHARPRAAECLRTFRRGLSRMRRVPEARERL